jgi:hypothetical protein
MSLAKLEERLNAVLERITADDFLSGRGLGNEVPFYAFDYPPEFEPKVRDHIQFLVETAPKRRPGVRIKVINLFEVLIRVLEARGLYDKSVAMQKSKGDQALLKAIRAPLEADKVAAEVMAELQADPCDVLLMTGVGSAYPLVRTHTLLNSLQPRLGSLPLVLFYPGRYDGQSLQLFGLLGEKPYYRAFRLVS